MMFPENVIEKIYSALSKFSITDVVSLITIISSVTCIFIYFIAGKLGLNGIDSTGLDLFLLVSISIFIIINFRKIESILFEHTNINKKIDDTIAQNKKAIDTSITLNINKIEDKLTLDRQAIDSKIAHISRDVAIIKTELKTKAESSSVQINVINNQNDFYKLLSDKVTGAQHHVRLTHLDPWAPTSLVYANENRVDYFAIIYNFIITNQNVDVKRIINIPTDDKLNWVSDLIKKTDLIPNLHLAYIKIDDIENSFPLSVISCQIIDDDKMFILNPNFNYVPEGEFKPCLYIENREFVTIYKEYYDRLWNELRSRNCTYGCLIKDGPGQDKFEKNLSKIKNNIKM